MIIVRANYSDFEEIEQMIDKTYAEIQEKIKFEITTLIDNQKKLNNYIRVYRRQGVWEEEPSNSCYIKNGFIKKKEKANKTKLIIFLLKIAFVLLKFDNVSLQEKSIIIIEII